MAELNLDAVDIKPREGMVAIQFVDDDGDEEGSETSYPSTTEGPDYNGCLATVVGVGDKVKDVKKGSIVVTSRWARDGGTKVGSKTRIVSAFDIIATLKT